MTQAELTESIGITQGYLFDLEAGKRKGPVALHQKIARALGVPMSRPTRHASPSLDMRSKT
jgi:DNA-binding XRE family transcriptional regulator